MWYHTSAEMLNSKSVAQLRLLDHYQTLPGSTGLCSVDTSMQVQHRPLYLRQVQEQLRLLLTTTRNFQAAQASVV
jgi:hypothetical protein